MQVSTPPRQYASAAEQFRNRLGRAAKLHSGTYSSDNEDEQISSAVDAVEEEGVTKPDKAVRHAQAEMGTEAGHSSDGTDRQPDAEEAWEADQHTATDEEQQQEQQQQHISPGLHQQQQKSKAALRVGQLHSIDSVHRFLNRLNQPTQHQSPLQSKSSLLPRQARLEMQSQSRARSQSESQSQSQSQSQAQSESKPTWQSQSAQSWRLPQTDPKANPSQLRQQLSDASSLPHGSGLRGTHSLTPSAAVRHTSDGQTDPRPGTGGSTPSEEGSYQGRALEQADVASSPMQAAVAAVAGRLQSVQHGLASAEGRLAELTGRRPVNR